jgi:hypothetical protein
MEAVCAHAVAERTSAATKKAVRSLIEVPLMDRNVPALLLPSVGVRTEIKGLFASSSSSDTNFSEDYDHDTCKLPYRMRHHNYTFVEFLRGDRKTWDSDCVSETGFGEQK